MRHGAPVIDRARAGRHRRRSAPRRSACRGARRRSGGARTPARRHAAVEVRDRHAPAPDPPRADARAQRRRHQRHGADAVGEVVPHQPAAAAAVGGDSQKRCRIVAGRRADADRRSAGRSRGGRCAGRRCTAARRRPAAPSGHAACRRPARSTSSATVLVSWAPPTPWPRRCARAPRSSAGPAKPREPQRQMRTGSVPARVRCARWPAATSPSARRRPSLASASASAAPALGSDAPRRLVVGIGADRGHARPEPVVGVVGDDRGPAVGRDGSRAAGARRGWCPAATMRVLDAAAQRHALEEDLVPRRARPCPRTRRRATARRR